MSDDNTHVNYGVSITDVLEHDLFKDLQRDPPHPKFMDERALRIALWDFGLDVSQPINEVQCLHRNLRRQVVDCVQYRGAERTDKSWLNSGCASIEAHKLSTKDKSLQSELDRMRNRG